MFAKRFEGEYISSNENSSFRCVWTNDNDRYACKVYRNHWGSGELVEGDIAAVDADSIPTHDLLTAGFPCQAFSVAGQRKGFEDSRGTLFYHIARVAAAKRPPLLLLENVKGLLSAQEGYCFHRILETLDELGYLLEWQVLDSQHFGVPQHRERVFIVGHLRGTGGREIFPLPAAGEHAVKVQGEGPWVRSAHSLVASTLKQRYYKDGSENLIQVYDDYNQTVREDGIVPTIRSTQSRAAPRNASKIIQKQRIRRLTPVECERLQGFPDNWTKGVSDTQRYKLLGNAVTVNVIRYLGQRLLEEGRYIDLPDMEVTE